MDDMQFYIDHVTMKKSELFVMLALKVCEICEVDYQLLIDGSKLQSVVDARMLCVQYLRRIGLSNDDIAAIAYRLKHGSSPDEETIKRKAKGIDKMFMRYSDRCMQSYAFCLLSKTIKDWCHETYNDMYCVGMKPLPVK